LIKTKKGKTKMSTREQFLADAEAAKELEAEVKTPEDRKVLQEMRDQIRTEREETLSTLGHQALLPGGITAPLDEVKQAREAGHDMAPGSHPHSR
jgi:hypothetical protein